MIADVAVNASSVITVLVVLVLLFAAIYLFRRM